MNRPIGWVMSAALLALGAPGVASAATVSFSSSSGTLGVGGSTSVAVVISGLGAGGAPSVGVFDFDVTFDPSLLSLGGVTFGTGLDVPDELGNFSFQSTTYSVPGTVNVYELSFDSVDDLNLFQTGSFTLFTLLFEGVAPGTSSLRLTINALGDAAGAALTPDPVLNGSLQVVPLPAAAWLLLSGLGGLGILGRRRRA